MFHLTSSPMVEWVTELQSACLILVLHQEYTLGLYTLQSFHIDVCDFHSERQEVHIVVSEKQAVQHYSGLYGEIDLVFSSAIFHCNVFFYMSKPFTLVDTVHVKSTTALGVLLIMHDCIIMQKQPFFIG